MVGVWQFAIVAVCHAGSIPAWCRLPEKYHISPVSTLGHHCIDQDSSFHSGVNVYLVRQRGKCVQ